MFELGILVGMFATVVCFLKGRWRAGFGAIGIGTVLIAILLTQGDTSSAEPSGVTSVLIVLGIPLWAAISLVLAWPAAKPGSHWDRRSATDPNGELLLGAEPFVHRLGRSILGAVFGALPTIVFMAVVLATLEGDEAQLAFIGLPVGLFGLLFGGWIGFNWLPRRAVGDELRNHHLT